MKRVKLSTIWKQFWTDYISEVSVFLSLLYVTEISIKQDLFLKYLEDIGKRCLETILCQLKARLKGPDPFSEM